MQKKFEGLLIIVVGLAICFVGILTMMRPPIYQAVVRVKISAEPENVFTDRQGNPEPLSYDPYFIQTEFEVIQSEVVLGKVVDELDLAQKWGDRYQGGVPFKRSEAIKLLQRKIGFQPVRNTRLVEVDVVDEDPAEAALIANTIAKAYSDFREGQYRQQLTQGIKTLEDGRHEQEQKMTSLQATLGKLKTELHVPDSLPEDELKTNYPGYFAAKQELSESKGLWEKLGTKITDLKNRPMEEAVEIVDAATPPVEPIKRNWPRGVAGLIAGIGCVGFGLKRML